MTRRPSEHIPVAAPDIQLPESVEQIIRANGVDLRVQTFGDPTEAATRELIGLDVDRAVNVASSQINHFVMDTGEPIRGRLGEIAVPTLVIHGDLDPVFPLGHADALRREIPGASLVVLERTGQELPRPAWDIVVPAIIRHSATREGR